MLLQQLRQLWAAEHLMLQHNRHARFQRIPILTQHLLRTNKQQITPDVRGWLLASKARQMKVILCSPCWLQPCSKVPPGGLSPINSYKQGGQYPTKPLNPGF